MAAAISLSAGFNPFAAAWAGYERALRRRPVLTQAISSAALWGLGDGMAQRIESRGRSPLDVRRVALTAAFGGAVIGPVGHVWYTMLERLVLRMGLACSMKSMLFKVTVDNLIYSPCYVFGFFAYGCMIIDGLTASQFVDKMREEFLPTMLTEAMVWPPYMAFVFGRVPVKHQLLAVNIATLFDVCFLSYIRTAEDAQRQQAATVEAAAAAPAQATAGKLKAPAAQQQQQAAPRSAGEARARELSACLHDATPEPSLGRMALMAASTTSYSYSKQEYGTQCESATARDP